MSIIKSFAQFINTGEVHKDDFIPDGTYNIINLQLKKLKSGTGISAATVDKNNKNLINVIDDDEIQYNFDMTSNKLTRK